MGVEYKRYLIPRQNAYRPDPIELVSFIQLMAEGSWISMPESGESKDIFLRVPPVRTKQLVPLPPDKSWLSGRLARDFLLTFSIDNLLWTSVKYPFVECPTLPEHIYYDLELHGGYDYFYHVSDVIEPFQSTFCRCGANLQYDPTDDPVFYDSRLMAECRSCGQPFDPSGLDAELRDGWTGEKLAPVKGGATYRFALVIDCGKCWHGWERKADIHPDFRPCAKTISEFHFMMWKIGISDWPSRQELRYSELDTAF